MIRNFVRAHELELAYVASGAVLFFVFLAATFPYTEALSEILAPVGLTLSASGQQLSFPFGIRVDHVRLIDPEHRALLEGAQVRITPSILSLLMGHPGVRVNFKGYGGMVAFSAGRAADATALTLNLAGVQLAQYPAPRMIGAQISGTLFAAGYLDLSARNIESDSGRLRLSTKDTSFRIAAGTPQVRLGQVTAALALRRGKLVVEELQSRGGDVTLSARGVIELRPNLADSTIAIKFALQADPAARSRIGFMFNLLPHPPGSSPYFLHGTLAAPLLS